LKFVRERHQKILGELLEKGELNDALIASIKSAITDFRENYYKKI
jgi:hypothetical protein